MKIAVLSDLHLEWVNGTYAVNTLPEANVLVLAGDIFTAKAIKNIKIAIGYSNFLAAVNKKYPKVIYITGNHEYYGMDMSEAKNVIRKTLEPYQNIIFLDNSSVLIDNVKFIGSTLWTNFAGEDPRIMFYSERGITDFKVIRRNGKVFRPLDAVELNTKALNFIKKEFETPAEKNVVVTHFTPSIKSIHPKWGTDMLNRYFSNDVPWGLINKADLWIHGHTHDPFDYNIKNTRIVCNPCGYPNEYNGFDPGKVVEI